MNIKTIIVAFILVIPLSEAIADTDWCYEYIKGDDYDLAIGACSSIIASGKFDGRELDAAYYNRGNAYSDKGDYDRAISDYTRYIEVDPEYVQMSTTTAARPTVSKATTTGPYPTIPGPSS